MSRKNALSAASAIALVTALVTTTGATAAQASGAPPTITAVTPYSSFGHVLAASVPANVILAAVQCPTRGRCVAVGKGINAGGHQAAVVAVRNLGRWRAQAAPLPSGATSSGLTGLACPSSSRCEAVGWFATASGPGVLAEAWDGKGWSAQQAPIPLDAKSAVLSGVSCTSPDACMAVGYGLSTFAGTLSVAERFDGATWTITPTPAHPQGSYNTLLASVSCPSTAMCTAVGSIDPNPGPTAPLVETWDGTTWTVVTTPPPPAASYSWLGGVACPTAIRCVAVGAYYTYTTQRMEVPLVESWDGSTWAVGSAPLAPGSAYSNLQAVSCTSAIACTAVGGTLDTGTPLAETWDETLWAVHPTITPSGAGPYTLFTSVGCTTPRVCTAVGGETTATGESDLIEAWVESAVTVQDV